MLALREELYMKQMKKVSFVFQSINQLIIFNCHNNKNNNNNNFYFLKSVRRSYIRGAYRVDK